MGPKNKLFQNLNKLIKSGDFLAANSLLEQGTLEYLDGSDVSFFKAKIYQSCRQFEEAERAAVTGLMISPSHYGLYRILGEVLGELGKDESAKKCIRGSQLDHYINEKYFGAENERLAVVTETAQKNLSKILYREGEKPLPDIIRPDNQQLRPEFSRNSMFDSEPQVFRLKNGKVWFDGHNLCVYSSNDELVNSCTMGNPLLVESARKGKSLSKIDGILGVAVARSSDNYFHWMTDVAPSFHLLDCMTENSGDIDRYLVSHSDRAFQTEFMELAGVNVESVIRSAGENGCYFTADLLLVPVFRHRMAMGMGQWAVNYLEEIGRKAIGPSDFRNAKRRIYISRRDVASRGVENELELIDYLKFYGFVDVVLDGLSLSEQIDLFREAEVILAPHGAGLTNLVHSMEGATVIEFFSEFVQPCFRSLSALKRLRYCHFSTIDKISSNDDLAASKRKHIIQHEGYGVPLDYLENMFSKLNIDRVIDESKGYESDVNAA